MIDQLEHILAKMDVADPTSCVLTAYTLPGREINGRTFPSPTFLVPRELEKHFKEKYPEAKATPVTGVLYTYKMDEVLGEPSIKCLHCKMRSFNPNDIENKYCGNCHRWLEEGEYEL